MAGIPQGLDADAEDVIWALQTADALWKRGERIDAIVWLRRAAQSAGEAEDDDRALSLARDAAELAEWVSQNASAAPSGTTSAPPPAAPPTAGAAVDAFLKESEDTAPPPPVPASPPPPPKLPPQSANVAAAEPVSSPRAARVASAAEVHAGMLDPWADAERPPAQAAPPPPPPPRRRHPAPPPRPEP